jgi:hypothetical protein
LKAPSRHLERIELPLRSSISQCGKKLKASACGTANSIMSARPSCGSQHVARGLQVGQQLGGLRQQGLSGGRQARRVGAAVDQVDAGPGLQRLDAAAEGRLRDVPQLRRAREAARLGQADEVLKPFGFHGA